METKCGHLLAKYFEKTLKLLLRGLVQRKLGAIGEVKKK